MPHVVWMLNVCSEVFLENYQFNNIPHAIIEAIEDWKILFEYIIAVPWGNCSLFGGWLWIERKANFLGVGPQL